jgi:enoyl-CoA hydratase/carnithine racemase
MTTAIPAYDTIAVAVADQVATVTLNRPDQLNAWDWQMHRELRHCYAALDADDGVRAIVLTGAGRAFCAGASLVPTGATFDGSRDPRAFDARYPGATAEAPELLTPVIAAINGPAVGAGLTMAMACDIRVAADDAKLGFVFNRRGVMPDADLLWSLPRLIGYARAMDVLLTGRIFTGKEAAELGLASRSAPRDEVLALATQMARDIAVNVAPVSAALTKQVTRQFLEETDRAAALERQRILFRWCGQQPDAREGVAAFLQRRAPQWQLSKHTPLPPQAFPDDAPAGPAGPAGQEGQ